MDMTLYGGFDDDGNEWAYVCRDDGETDIARFFGENAGVMAQIFMEKLDVIATAKQFIADYNATLNAAEIAPNGDDFNRLCQGVDDILLFNPAPEIVVTEEGR